MNLEQVPGIVEWVKKHLVLSVIAVIVGLVAYGGWKFIDRYAQRAGEDAAANYAELKHTVTLYAEVERALQPFLPRYNISRLGVARFHDSVRDIGNSGLFYYSYEVMVAAPGVKADLPLRVPAATISGILPDLFLDRPVFVWVREMDSGSLKELLMSHGIKAEQIIPIFDLSNRLIGMMTVAWVIESEVPKQSERAQMIKDLRTIATRIGAFLSARR